MTHPVLVLRPPARRGRHLVLSGDLLLGGDDQVTVSALIGQDTQEWVKREGRKALGGLVGRLDRAKRLMGRYVKLEGDWSRGGDLGALSFDVLTTAAGTARLAGPSDDARAAASTYLASTGRMGPEAEEQARADLMALEHAAAEDDHVAAWHRSLIDVAGAVMRGEAPEDEHALDVCRALDQVAGAACCDECAKGHACEGDACSPSLPVEYDVEDAILLPDETADRVGCRCADALGYRSYSKIAPRLSVQEAAKRVRAITAGCGCG